MIREVRPFHAVLLDLMEEYSKDDAEYVNPHLLGAIMSGLRETGKTVPDEIEQWANDMWGH